MDLEIMRFIFFFFKQKTAYEMRISDWSSDVCSSDLEHCRAGQRREREEEAELGRGLAVDPERHRAEDRRARAADPGDHRDALDQPAEDRMACRPIGDAADVPCLCEPLDEEDRESGG